MYFTAFHADVLKWLWLKMLLLLTWVLI